MPGKSQSRRAERKDRSQNRNTCLDRAVQLWQLEHDKPNALSLKKICERVETEFFDETGQRVHLSDSTLSRRVKGGRSMEQAGEEMAWIGVSEGREVIAYIQECAGRGFPLNHKRIREHVLDPELLGHVSFRRVCKSVHKSDIIS